MQILPGRKAALARCCGVALLFAPLAGIAQAQAAPAAQNTDQNGVTVVGAPIYDPADHREVVVMDAKIDKDNPEKSAAIVIVFEKSDENYQYNGTTGSQILSFVSASEWQKFVALWSKARSAHGESKDGYYFNGVTELGLGKDSDGDIRFTMAGNPDDKNLPQDLNVFLLSPKAFAAFDGIVKDVSLYFRK